MCLLNNYDSNREHVIKALNFGLQNKNNLLFGKKFNSERSLSLKVFKTNYD
jgi:hypothetical protein